MAIVAAGSAFSYRVSVTAPAMRVALRAHNTRESATTSSDGMPLAHNITGFAPGGVSAIRHPSPAIRLNASSNTPAGCPPEIRYFPSTTTAGTALIPRDRHSASAARTSAA